MAVDPIATGTLPFPSVYDASDGELYVVNTGSADVSVLRDERVVASVNVGGNASFPAYDPKNGYVYVPDRVASNVSVLDGTQVVASVDVGMAPRFAEYDSGNGEVYVTDYLSGTVSVINGTTLVATIYVGSGPIFEAYDSATGWVYVDNTGSADVSVINGTTTVATIPSGVYPLEPAFDPGNGDLYVPNFASGTVSILNGSSTAAVVAVGAGPTDATYDPETGDVYVTNFDSDNVSVLHGTRVVASVAVGREPMYAAYDPQTNYLFVPNEASDTVSVIVEATDVGTVEVGSLPELATYDPSDGRVYVSVADVSTGGPGGVSVILADHGYPVTFAESGLPTGAPWFVIASGTVLGSNSPTITFAEPNGTYAYAVSSSGGRAPSPAYGSIAVDDASRSVALTFAPQAAYAVNLTEAGLPVGTNWSATIAGATVATTASTLEFSATTGVVEYSIGPVPGWTTAIYSGYIDVNGSAVSLTLEWHRVLFAVTFDEYGLPPPGLWSVEITAPPYGPSAAGGGPTLTVELPNGSYAYSVFALVQRYSSPGGSFVLAGEPLSFAVAFLPSPYGVTFNETGLPVDTAWSVTLQGDTVVSTSSSLTFEVPNGTPTYEIGTVPGWSTPSYSGEIAVNGQAVYRTIVWTEVNYTVTFSETGLPAGTSWWVGAADGPSASSAGTQLALRVPNGSYAYSVRSTNGTFAAPPGVFSVTGTVYFVAVAFSPVTFAVVFSETGLPAGTPWSLALDGGVTGSTGDGLVLFELVNGSHSFLVHAPPGYSASPRSGSVTVSGAATSVSVRFTALSVGFLGLPGLYGYVLLVGPIVVAAAIVATALIARRPLHRSLTGTPKGRRSGSDRT
jgi:YVTN family beta-propeller protein